MIKAFVLLGIFAMSFAFGDILLREETDATFKEYVTGFLKGVNEKKDIKELEDCIKGGDQLMVDTKAALQLIMTLEDNNLKAGVKGLLDATSAMLKILSPCSASYNQLKKLAEFIAKADIQKLIKKIMGQPGPYFHLAVDGVEAFTALKYAEAGIAVGTMQRMFFLNRVESTPMVDFMTGFLVGIAEKGTIANLMSCIKESEALFAKFKSSMEHIKNMGNEDLNEGAKLLIEATKDLLDMLKACMETYSSLKKLASEVGRADIKKMVQKMLSSPGTYFHLSIDALEGFLDKKYANAGKGIGTMLRLLFL